MSFPLTKLAKVILTVVDAANAARSLTGAAGGVVSSALASIALWRGWGQK